MKKILLVISILFGVIGVSLIFGNTFLNSIYYDQVLINKQEKIFKEDSKDVVKDTIQKNKSNIVEKDNDFEFNNVKSIKVKELRLAKLNAEKLVGIVYVPSINMKLPILHGATHENMLVGAGTLKKSQTMGNGNYSIASHNHPNPNILFSSIKNINNGDIMYITDYEHVYIYKMIQKEVIEPTRIDVIEDKINQSLLTLVSCYSPDGSDRIYVTGDLQEIVDFEEMSLDWQENLLRE